MANKKTGQKDCVFCQIVAGKIPAEKIWEDKEFLAILDRNPNMEGMTLVLTKRHYGSYVFKMPLDAYQRFCVAAQKVAQVLDKALGTKKTAFVIEGMLVNHAHIKLYPLRGVKKDFVKTRPTRRVFYDRYPGFIDTRLGSRASLRKLRELGGKIRKFSQIKDS